MTKKVTPHISGSHASLYLQHQNGDPIQGALGLSHSSIIPIGLGDTQFLVITNNAWMEHPHPIRVVIVDQVTGGRPMFDIEPHRSITVPVTATYTNQLILVAVYPVRKREDGEDEAPVGMRYTGRIHYNTDGGAGPARSDWVPAVFETDGGAGLAKGNLVPVGVEPELFALMFRVEQPVEV